MTPACVEERETKDALARVDSPGTESLDIGVAKAEAVTAVWTKRSLILGYAGAYAVLVLVSVQQTAITSLTPYITSEYSAHSLIPVTVLLAFIISGVTQLPVSKLIDIWGRPQGLSIMTILCVLGLILMAFCNSVQMYAAAQVFYEVGYGGIMYTLRVFVTENASLKYRPLAFGLSMSPYLVSTFAAPAFAQTYQQAGITRWAFGTFAFVLPSLVMIVLVVLLLNQRKAEKLDSLVKEKTRIRHQTLLQRMLHYSVDFDFLGILLACVGPILILLPCNLATSGLGGWDSGPTITMLVLGFSLVLVLVAYELCWAPKSFIPFDLLRNSTVWGICLCQIGEYISLFCWFSYFPSHLQVVHNLNIRDAGYVTNIYYLGQALLASFTGFIMRDPKANRSKALTVLGFALFTLSTGLKIRFRHSHSSFGGVIASQVLLSISAGIVSVSQTMAILGAGNHKRSNIAILMALIYLSSMIGASLAVSVSGAIWTNTLPRYLAEYFPVEAQSALPEIYGSIVKQLSYEPGTTVRQAISRAFSEVHRTMMITATASLVLSWIGVFMIREPDERQEANLDRD